MMIIDYLCLIFEALHKENEFALFTKVVAYTGHVFWNLFIAGKYLSTDMTDLKTVMSKSDFR